MIKLSELLNSKYKNFVIEWIENTNKIIIRQTKFDKDICLHKTKVNNYDCSLIQYTLTDDDIRNNKLYLLGYIIHQDNDIYGILNVQFDDFEKIEINKNIEGKFNIVYSTKENSTILKTFDTYPNKNIVYILTEFLTDVCH